MSGPHIALIRQKYNAAGGAERFVSRAIQALTANGAEVTLLTRRWEAIEGMRTIKVDPFYIGNVWRDWGFARAVAKTLEQHRFDLVQSHERLDCCDLYRAGDGVHREWLRQRARHAGWGARVSMRLNPFHAYNQAAERRMFESARLKAVICISEMVKQDILRHFRIDPAKLHVIYNGIDTERYHPRLKAEYRGPVRQSLGIGEDELVLVFVGAGYERKGLATLIRAVHAAKLPVRALVVGKDKHEARYRRLAQQLGVADRVHFLGAQRDARPYYAAGDAFVFPTIYEPFGNVHLEAMAIGLPVIASRAAGGAEFITPGENGEVCEAGDVAGFAAAIDRLESVAHCARLGEAARARVEPYTLARMADEMAALYRRLLGT